VKPEEKKLATGSGFSTCCKKKTRVIDSRRRSKGIRRRRICDTCGTRYSTIEVIEVVEEIPEDNKARSMLASDMAMMTSLGADHRKMIRDLLALLTNRKTNEIEQ
jgi:transcriptional regulator NrdR family protein